MSNLYTDVSPHLRSETNTGRIMRDVLIALLPALVASVIVFGARSLLVVAVCVASCVLAEFIFEKIVKRPNTIFDLSACVTGVLLAFNLPVDIPIWQAVFGSLVAIVVVKQLFGGIGQNFANPAITARIVMLLAFSGTMTSFVSPDGISAATPLGILSGEAADALPSIKYMLLGVHGGSLGETSTLAILIGAAYLVFRRVISLTTPIAFIGTVFVLTWLLNANPVYHILSGGLMLGAFFMATDYSTTPATNSGRIIFGIGCGLITVLIRVWGSYPEGVSFAILLMNILTPHISSLTLTRPRGGRKNG